MSEDKRSSSSSESEISACSSKYDPMKALYSENVKIPVTNAPMYENMSQFEAAQKTSDVIPVGHGALVKKREEEKERKKQEEARELEEKNRQRFAKYEGMVPTTGRDRVVRNVLTRITHMSGPLAVLKLCVDQRLRIKVITRNERGLRGDLYGTLIAFDKQWNLAMSDVIETWKRKGIKKRKVPPALGTPVPPGTASGISPVPQVTETPLGKGVWECTRHIPQLMVRGEHVVLINTTVEQSVNKMAVEKKIEKEINTTVEQSVIKSEIEEEIQKEIKTEIKTESDL